MGLLDSELLRMEGKVWRHPAAHQAWVEAEKKKAEEQKKVKEAKKLEVAKEKEQAKMVRKQLKETGRLNDMKEAGKRLEKLRGDVVLLELKAKGLSKEKATELADAERKVREAEQRNGVVGAEAEETAAAMLLRREKELEQKKKDFESTQSMIAAQRRRELLEYKHQLGLPSSPTPFDHHRMQQRQTGSQLRYPRPNRSNTAIYDDPEFWKLSEEDQRLLEGMDWWEQERMGFGPYGQGAGGMGKGLGKSKGRGGMSALEELEMAELGEDGHEVDEDGRRVGEPLYDPRQLPGFFFLSTTQPPPGLTVLRVLGPLEAAVLVALPPPDTDLTPAERKLVRDELAVDEAFAKSDLIEETMKNKGNCLLGFRTEMVDLGDGTAELVAQATAAIARPSQQQPHYQRHPSVGRGGGLGGNLWGALDDLQGGQAWNGGGLGGHDDLFGMDGDDWGGGFGASAGGGRGGGHHGGWGAGQGGFAGRGRGNGWGGGDRGGAAGGRGWADYQRMLAHERIKRDQALTGDLPPSGYGYGHQQHHFGAPKAGMSQCGPTAPLQQQQQQQEHHTPQAYPGYPRHAAHPNAQGHPPGSFPTPHSHQQTPKPGPTRTKEDRSLSGNAFSMGTPAFPSTSWAEPSPQIPTGSEMAAGNGSGTQVDGDADILRRLAEEEKRLEEILRQQEAQGAAPKGAAAGAGDKEKEQPAARSWWPF